MKDIRPITQIALYKAEGIFTPPSPPAYREASSERALRVLALLPLLDTLFATSVTQTDTVFTSSLPTSLRPLFCSSTHAPGLIHHSHHHSHCC